MYLNPYYKTHVIRHGKMYVLSILGFIDNLLKKLQVQKSTTSSVELG